MRRYIWDELLTYHKVIRTVKELSTSEKHPRKDKRHPIFECSPGHEIIDEEIFISDNNKILEYEDEEEMINMNNEDIEGENIELEEDKDRIYIIDT